MSQTIRIESPRFGTLEVSPERVIEFPLGLPGFEDCRKFSLFHPEDGAPDFFILQSLDQPEVAFTLADPGRLGFSYEICLSDDENAALGEADPAEMAVAVLLRRSGEASDGPISANLNAPLVINLRNRRGLQHQFARLDYQLTLRSPG